MQKTMDLGILRESAQAELVRSKFSEKSISGFTSEWQKFFDYAAKRGATDYTSDLAEEYLMHRCSKCSGNGDSITHYEKVIRRHIRALNDVVVFGHIRHGNTRNRIFPPALEDAVEAYFEEYTRIFSRETLKIYRSHLHRLAHFLNDAGVSRWQDLQAKERGGDMTM